MGRFYSAVFDNIAVSAAQDFFELNAASASAVKLHSIEICQSSDVGDAAEELLRWSIIRAHSTSGSGGAAVTPVSLEQAMATAFGGTVERNNTTLATGGTPLTLYAGTFNVRSGLLYVPTPECRPVISGGGRLVVRLLAAPADELTMSGTMVFEAA